MAISLRPMLPTDLSAVIEVQKKTFSTDLLEDLNVFQNRLSRFGQYFLVACDKQYVVGYVVAFPWALGDSPVNNQCFPEKLPTPTCFYLHDIALLPSHQGQGIARLMLENIDENARELGFQSLSLVSVAQSGKYWDRIGFSELPVSPEKRQMILKVYGDGARLMVRRQI
jgi:GNAT superfamily N-acetyltransferase